jgi:N-acetylglucosaminyl-diphospho-decaprenol L-rhamnosyltransferase
LATDLSVVIVSYNTRDILRACLASIERSTSIAPQVIVVDNGSADGSRAMVGAEFPAVQLIESENVGFAAGSNRGIAVASGRYIALLNPDTEVVDDALGVLVRFMDAHARAGLAGGLLLNPDGSIQPSAFHFPTLWMSFFDFYTINHRLINSRLNGRYPRAQYSRAFTIDHPLGACMIVRRAVIDQVGLLDESFFMYCEEIDWCLRIKGAGWEIWHVAGAPVIHHGGQSTRQFRNRMFVELHRSRYLLFAKHYSSLFCRANRQIVRLGLAREMLRARWQHRRGQLTDSDYGERMAAYREVWAL